MSIIINNLSKVYSDSTVALKNINLNIGAGITGLLGPNGAGKSTLMKIITTVLEKTSGEVNIFDFQLDKDKEEIREIIGYLPQEFGLYGNLNAVEFLDYIALFYNQGQSNKRKERIEYLLNRVNLYDARDKKLNTYSGGMKRRLGIAQALLNNPGVLIIDEPTAGLDPEERIKFRALLRDMLLEDKERIVIFSTHIVNDISALCSKVVVLHQGDIRYKGDINHLKKITEGKVWMLNTKQQKLREIEDNEILINSRVESDGSLSIRFVSSREYEGATPVEPTVEDSYMYIVKNGMDKSKALSR